MNMSGKLKDANGRILWDGTDVLVPDGRGRFGKKLYRKGRVVSCGTKNVKVMVAHGSDRVALVVVPADTVQRADMRVTVR